MAKTETLTDNFATQDTGKWSWWAAASVSSGQLALACNNSYTGTIYSNTSYDLTASSIVVQLVQATNAGNGGTQLVFNVSTSQAANTSNSIGFYLNNGTLYYMNAGGSFASVGTTTYSSTTHKWLRVRESGGTVYWDTSADGVSWTNRASSASPAITVTTVYVNFVVGYFGTEPSPGSALFDNFNLPPAASPGQFFVMF